MLRPDTVRCTVHEATYTVGNSNNIIQGHLPSVVDRQTRQVGNNCQDASCCFKLQPARNLRYHSLLSSLNSVVEHTWVPSHVSKEMVIYGSVAGPTSAHVEHRNINIPAVIIWQTCTMVADVHHEHPCRTKLWRRTYLASITTWHPCHVRCHLACT